jgi:hypothetical protein
MARIQNDVEIKCPFYITIATKSITCEGITDECTTKLLFNTPKLRDKHCRIFCENKYQYCEIYRMLEAKYED